jgi:hypothetical protein
MTHVNNTLKARATGERQLYRMMYNNRANAVTAMPIERSELIKAIIVEKLSGPFIAAG